MQTRYVIRGLVLSFLGLLILGCGYHFNGVSDSLSGIDQFIRGNQFQVVGDEAEADVVVRGTVKRISTSHVSYEDADLGAEERVSLTVEIVFENRETGRTLWEDRNFSDTEDYLVIKSLESKRKALIKLSGDMAERAYRLMIAGF